MIVQILIRYSDTTKTIFEISAALKDPLENRLRKAGYIDGTGRDIHLLLVCVGMVFEEHVSTYIVILFMNIKIILLWMSLN